VATTTGAADTDKAAFAARLKEFEGKEAGEPEQGADPVNQPMIRHWVEAVGDENPIYTQPEAAEQSVHGEIVAPPVMLQAWVMRGVRPRPTDGGNARDELMTLIDDAGFTSVVATNCEQEYHRYLHLGDHLSTTTIIESVSDEKATGLGVGHFVTTRVDYRTDEGELVATMRFRILKFKPGTGRPPPKAEENLRPLRPRPALTQDNAFWFEGARQHRLLIQRRGHPPRRQRHRRRAGRHQCRHAGGGRMGRPRPGPFPAGFPSRQGSEVGNNGLHVLRGAGRSPRPGDAGLRGPRDFRAREGGRAQRGACRP
jgi:acyl dehydratase